MKFPSSNLNQVVIKAMSKIIGLLSVAFHLYETHLKLGKENVL